MAESESCLVIAGSLALTEGYYSSLVTAALTPKGKEKKTFIKAFRHTMSGGLVK